MKRAVLIGLVLLVAFQMNGYGQKSGNQVKVKPDTLAVDSVKYELIVLDPGFESWLASKPPMTYYSQNYYEIKNRLYVIEWNYRYSQPFTFGDLYDSRIDYDPKIDYGLEFNYRLYYYFLFFEATNHIKLLPGSR
jgi:hypothetical protein